MKFSSISNFLVIENKKYLVIGNFEVAEFLIQPENLALFDDPKTAVICSLPLESEGKKTDIALQRLLSSSEKKIMWSAGIISTSCIRYSSLSWHTIHCTDCECTIEDVILETLNFGFQQIFISSIIDFHFTNQDKPVNSPAAKEIYGTIEKLKNGISVAFDGERMDPAHTGTSIVANELAKQISKHPFVNHFEIILPASMSVHWLDEGLPYQVSGSKKDRKNTFDVLFRPCQSWQSSWLTPEWSRFKIHIQWWLDFISFTIPIYGNGQQGLNRNVHSAISAFSVYEGTLFLSDSVQRTSELFLGAPAKNADVLPCTIETARKNLKKRKRKTIIVVGNSFLHKGRIFALQVFKEILLLDHEFEMIFIGGSPGFADSEILEKSFYKKNKELAKKVTILGKISTDELTTIMSGASILLAASTTEGFGLTPFEAAHYGVLPFTANIDAWGAYVQAPYWLNLDSATKSAKVVLEVFSSDEKKQLQINSFLEWPKLNTWESIADKAVFYFAQVLYREAQERQESRKDMNEVQSWIRSVIIRSPLLNKFTKRLLKLIK
jgi:glycosyltransferase involved in cell wall biosynthesis